MTETIYHSYVVGNRIFNYCPDELNVFLNYHTIISVKTGKEGRSPGDWYDPGDGYER